MSKSNSVIAGVWFALAALLITFAMVTLMQAENLFIIPAIVGLSFLLLLLGRQRIPRWKMSDDRFSVFMRNGGLCVAMLSSISIIFAGAS